MPFVLKQASVKNIFLCLFYLDLAFSLLPAWSLSPLYSIVSPDAWAKFWLLSSILAIISLGLIIIIVHNKIKINDITLTIFFLYGLFVLSCSVNGFKSGAFAFFGIPISLLLFFYIINDLKFKIANLKIVYYILLTWSIAPVIIMFTIPSISSSFFINPNGSFSSFSGFAVHRNFYGLIAGLTYVLVYFKRCSPVVKFFIYAVLSLGLILAGSRTSILAIILTFLLIIFLNPKISKLRKALVLFIISICAFFAYRIMSNPEYSVRNIENNDDREELYSGFYEIIKEKPFLGRGENVVFTSAAFQEGAPAHNFVLQTSANYGIPAMLCWCLLLVLVFKYGTNFKKIALTYLLLWGLTQPYWGFGVFSAHIVCILFVFHLLQCNLNDVNSRF